MALVKTALEIIATTAQAVRDEATKISNGGGEDFALRGDLKEIFGGSARDQSAASDLAAANDKQAAEKAA